MGRTKPGWTPPNDFDRGSGWFNRLNRRLFPYLGPPPLGPYDQEPAPDPVRAACPLCGAAMAEHEFARGNGPTKLYCPTPAQA
jgi:hypothetical protein